MTSGKSPDAQVAFVHVDDVEMETAMRGRASDILRKRMPLETGVRGLGMEFTCNFIKEGYRTPRHRHNFDQIRYTLEGVHNTGVADMEAGDCGYFPEGAYYGPQEQKGDTTLLLLQFQGANGEPFLGNEEVNAAYKDLIEAGAEFHDGICTLRKPDGSKINKDSFKAIFEKNTGRELEYPRPRYNEPVIMKPDRYHWIADRRQPGMRVKHLGTFTELRTAVSLVDLPAGSTMGETTQEDAEIRFLLRGSVVYENTPCREQTYFYMPPGAAVGAMHSPTGATFLTISLPLIDYWRDRLSH